MTISRWWTSTTPTMAAGTSTPRTRGDNTTNPEHVVLANCQASDGTLSSQMAYYYSTPDYTATHNPPHDIALISSFPPTNTSHQWADATTSGNFTDTGTIFTAILRPDVAQGAWAGTGNNGYGTFVCWEKTMPVNDENGGYLYEMAGTKCSQVYDCDHEETPSVTPSPLVSASSAASSAVNGGNGGLGTVGRIVVIAVTVSVGVILVLIGVLLFLRLLARKKGYSRGIFRLFAPPGLRKATTTSTTHTVATQTQPGQPQANAIPMEMHGSFAGAEMKGDEIFPPREMEQQILAQQLDPSWTGVEADSRPMRPELSASHWSRRSSVRYGDHG